MINAYENIRRLKPLHFVGRTTLYSGIIFGLINFFHTQPYSVLNNVEEWEISQRETNKPGLYINNWLIPLDNLVPGEITEPLPYTLIKSEEGSLHFYVSKEDYDVSVYSLDAQVRNKWNLESLLSPSTFQGKEGLRLNGYLAEEYIIKIVHYTKPLQNSEKKKVEKEVEGKVEIEQTKDTKQYLIHLVMDNKPSIKTPVKNDEILHPPPLGGT